MISDKAKQIIELNSFKNEILKIIRNMESKLMEQISIRAIELSTKISGFDDKILHFQEDFTNIKNTLADYKLKNEKINDYEKFQKKTDSILLTHDVRINQNREQIDTMKSKLEKIILENLLIPGFIGPSCKFKNISDYLSSIFKVETKNKSEKEQMKFDINSIKIKMDVMHKNLITLIDANGNRCNNYTNNKFEMYNNSFGEKFEEINNKVLDMKMKDIQTKIEVEKYVNEIKEYFEEIKKMELKIEKIVNDENNNKENKIIRSKDRQNTINIKNYFSSKEINKKYDFSRIEMKRERKYSFKMKTLRRVKKQEKEEIIENQKEIIKENNEEKENIIDEKKEKNEIKKEKEEKEEINKIQTIEEEKEKSKNSQIVESAEINNIKMNLQNYEKELKYIKQTLTEINIKISDFNVFKNKMNSMISKNIIKKNKKENSEENNKDIIKKESKILQTNLSDNNINNFTMENIYQNHNNTLLSEKDSDEYIRNLTNEKIYKNILYNKNNNNHRNNYMNIHNNIKLNYYDAVTPLINNYNRFHSPQNISYISENKNKIKFKNNIENNEILKDKDKTSIKDVKEIFLLKYKKLQLLKDNSFELKKNNLEENIINSTKNLIKENKNIKYNIIEDIKNNTFTQNQNNNSNQLYKKEITQINNSSNNINVNKKYKEIQLYNKMKKNKKECLSPDVEKLYREYFIKNNKEKEKIGNNSNIKIIPKKIVSVFGKTSYTPIKKRKNS